MPIESVNDFVVRFANVNGSGSASANELFARAVLRMGIPVAPRNIFPSNIQGLPTWYEVRISEAGHLGARGGTDLMVAMNPQTVINAPLAISCRRPANRREDGHRQAEARSPAMCRCQHPLKSTLGSSRPSSSPGPSYYRPPSSCFHFASSKNLSSHAFCNRANRPFSK